MRDLKTYLSVAPVLSTLWFGALAGLLIEINRFFPDALTFPFFSFQLFGRNEEDQRYNQISVTNPPFPFFSFFSFFSYFSNKGRKRKKKSGFNVCETRFQVRIKGILIIEAWGKMRVQGKNTRFLTEIPSFRLKQSFELIVLLIIYYGFDLLLLY